MQQARHKRRDPGTLKGVTVLVNLAAWGTVGMVGDGTYLSVNEAAALTGDGESTIRRLFDAGALEGFTTERGGHRRILRTSVDKLIADRTKPGRHAAE